MWRHLGRLTSFPLARSSLGCVVGGRAEKRPRVCGQWEGRCYSALPHAALDQWVDEMRRLCQPEKVHVCTGTEDENDALTRLLVDKGALIPLNPAIRPRCYLARSHPSDVARVEKQTFICSEQQEDAGPTNNWQNPTEMKALLRSKFGGCMRGRTMYVIPFSMGPLTSPFSKIGYQITDSPYVVVNMRVMTRIGKDVSAALGSREYVQCLHSVGSPITEGGEDPVWPCNLEKYIVHFPETKEIWSYGSGYGGNALLGKKSFALRIASVLGREGGWLAEHMLILSLTNPEGQTKYVCAAFPSACGKTNLAMLTPTLPGWKVKCVGDDIAWMRFGADGRLYAINPENGFFGVAPGTSVQSNPNAMDTIRNDTIFTNTAYDPQRGDVWWEGMGPPPSKLIDWTGQPWIAEEHFGKRPAAHANARFTTPIANCPIRDTEGDMERGVPISAIIFGGRRSTTLPLVYQAHTWQHGVFAGANVASEQTAAAEGSVGALRHDPFAMLPFCGYNMADYFAHWLNLPKLSPRPENLPKIFHVNWFRKDSNGKYLWPGYGENSRVLDWIFRRTDEPLQPSSIARDTAIGFLPTEKGINVSGLDVTRDAMERLLAVEKDGWLADLNSMEEFLQQFKHKTPAPLRNELSRIRSNLT